MAEETTTTQLPMWQQPYVAGAMGAAGDLASTPRHYYPGQGYVNFSAPTELAMGLQAQRALSGSPYESAMGGYLAGAMGQQQFNLAPSAMNAQMAQAGLGQANQAFAQTASGQMLGSNPYLDSQFNAASDAVTRQFQRATTPGINATFGMGGRTGSAAHQGAMQDAQQALGNQLGNMASNIYGSAYESERGRQMQAAGALQQGALGGIGAMGDLYGGVNQSRFQAASLAPQAQAMEYGNIDRLMNTGAMVDEQQRAILADAMSRYNYARDTPYENLNWLMGMVGGQGYGGTQYSNTPGNSIGKVLGGAGTGAGIGAAIGTGFMPGVGTAIGAGVGALGGGIAGYFA